MNEIDRKKLVSPCFLDTVLQFSGRKLNPILKFHSLFVRHFIISDTQALDNRLFQTDPLVSNLPYLFEDCSYDGLPLIMVLKRRSADFEELLLKDMLKIDTGGQHGMELSCLRRAQKTTLRCLRKTGMLNKKALANEIGYPFQVLKKIETHVSTAGYGRDLGEASFVHDPDRYRKLIFALLNLPSLPIQFGLKTKRARETLAHFADDDPGSSLSLSQGLGKTDRMGRTHVYQWRNRMRYRRLKNKELQSLSDSDFEKLLSGVISCADFAYLRNFSDSCGTSLMIDNLHWLPSSVVNQSFSSQLPFVEKADDAIEHLLDIKDGFFEGYGSEHLLSIRKQLDECGFTKKATREKIANLRRSYAFDSRLKEVEQALDEGNASDASNLLQKHVVVCCKKLVPRETYSWLDLFPAVWTFASDYAKIQSENRLSGVFGCATNTGVALLSVAGRIMSNRRNRTLIDAAAKSVCDLLLKKNT
jgi:hypothetical protein